MPVPCVCGKRPTENDGYCVCCDKCDTWFHCKCLSLTRKILKDVEKWFCPTCTRETDIFQKMDSKLEELKAYIDSKYANLSKSICESSGIINDNNNQNLVRDLEILRSNLTECTNLLESNKMEYENRISGLRQEKQVLAEEVEKLRIAVTKLNNLLELSKVEHETAITIMCQEKQHLAEEIESLRSSITNTNNLMEEQKIELEKCISELSVENNTLKTENKRLKRGRLSLSQTNKSMSQM